MSRYLAIHHACIQCSQLRPKKITMPALPLPHKPLRASRVAESEALWRRLLFDGLRPSVGTRSMLMSTFVQAGRCDLALEILFDARLAGGEVPHDMMKGAVCAAAKAGRWALALDLLEELVAQVVGADWKAKLSWGTEYGGGEALLVRGASMDAEVDTAAGGNNGTIRGDGRGSGGEEDTWEQSNAGFKQSIALERPNQRAVRALQREDDAIAGHTGKAKQREGKVTRKCNEANQTQWTLGREAAVLGSQLPNTVEGPVIPLSALGVPRRCAPQAAAPPLTSNEGVAVSSHGSGHKDCAGPSEGEGGGTASGRDRVETVMVDGYREEGMDIEVEDAMSFPTGLADSHGSWRPLTSHPDPHHSSSAGVEWETARHTASATDAHPDSPPLSVITFNAVISSLARAGKWQQACAVYRLMGGLGVAPDVFTWSGLASALAREGEYEQVRGTHSARLPAEVAGGCLHSVRGASWKLDVFNAPESTKCNGGALSLLEWQGGASTGSRVPLGVGLRTSPATVIGFSKREGVLLSSRVIG